MKKIYLLVLLLFLSCGIAGASTEAPAIVHINGINTSLDEANENANELTRAIREKGNTSRVFLGYNYSYTELFPYIGGAIDAIDAAVQGVVAAMQTGVKYSFDLTNKVFFFWDTSGITASTSNALQDTLDKVVAALMTFSDVKPGATFLIISDINSKVGSTAPLVLVPHSQGNFYANYIYDYLRSSRPTKIVGVATPAPFTAGNGDYINSSNDRVVSLIVPTARPANINIPKTPLDPMGHNLISVYLNPAILVDGVAIGREMVVAKILEALSALASDSSIPAEGAKVTLAWTGNFNLSLQAQNPDGTPAQALTTISDNYGTSSFSLQSVAPGTFQILMVKSLNGLWPSTVTLSVGTVTTTIPIATYMDYPDGSRYLDAIYIKPDGSISL